MKFGKPFRLDFVEGLPKSGGKNVILVVVDKLSNYCHLMALSHPYSANVVAQLMLDNVVKLHGVPTAIISDRDPIFISTFWKELFKSMGTKLKLNTAYHPSNGWPKLRGSISVSKCICAVYVVKNPSNGRIGCP